MTENELKNTSLIRTEELPRSQSIQLQEVKVSPTDGAYMSRNGRMVAVEVMTRYYGSIEIQAKEAFAESLEMHLKIIKI